MDLLNNILFIVVMLFGFGVLIFVHELGHFVAAKWAGIRTEGFAIGMGPVVFSWRKGIGLALGSTHGKVVARTGKAAAQLNDDELKQHGIGETEYSLRWVPIGGFVKMLGQEDANPNYVSDDPRSYNRCPIGKRMVVVSAGVIMNIIFGALLFIVAFIPGVKFEAPIIGDVSASMPAATATARNAEQLGVMTPGLLPGDQVLSIDGDPARTFADLKIAGALSSPGTALHLSVERRGVPEPLQFDITPKKDPSSGMLGIGVAPAYSTTLRMAGEVQGFEELLDRLGLGEQGVKPGMTLLRVDGQPVTAIQQLGQIVDASDGSPVATEWGIDPAAEPDVTAMLEVKPEFEVLRYTDPPDDAIQVSEQGLLGFVPLIEITSTEGSQNADVIHVGDIVLRINSVIGPRIADFRQEVGRHAGGSVDLRLLRDGTEVEVVATVDGQGKLNVMPAPAIGTPMLAESMREVRDAGAEEPRTTVAASVDLLPTSVIHSVDGVSVTDWTTILEALRLSTRQAYEDNVGTTVELVVAPPLPEAPNETIALDLVAGDVKTVHELGWTLAISPVMFEPEYVIRSSGNDPIRAITMGVEETHKALVLTYLTFRRLFQGSVGVEQLRGPVGIIHLGVKILPKGLTYFLFFLGLISVNLAVINFLPLPIVDGGLFLMLIYEKLKGRPPSIAFQNVATIVGLMLIGAIFLITFYNDIIRLFDGSV